MDGESSGTRKNLAVVQSEIINYSFKFMQSCQQECHLFVFSGSPLEYWEEVGGVGRITKEDVQGFKILFILITMLLSKCREISCRDYIGIHVHTSVLNALFLREFVEHFVERDFVVVVIDSFMHHAVGFNENDTLFRDRPIIQRMKSG